MSEAADGSDGEFGVIQSPIPHILGTNNTPTATEIRESVAQTTHQLASLNAGSASLQETCNRTRESLTAYMALLTPIRRMPPELMSEIFGHCLPRAVDEFIRPSLKNAPLLLTRICSTWRSIALSTSSLWCSIGVHNSSLYQSDLRADGMRVWLSRSGTRPLFLYLHETHSEPEYSKCLQVVTLHLSRCRKLRLSLSEEAVVAFIPRMTLPLLESVELDDWFSKQPKRSILEAFSNAPRLHSVETDWHHQILSRVSCIPWSQLGNLNLSKIPSFAECLEVLRHCQALTTCSLSFDDYVADMTVASATEDLPLWLPQLHTFKISMAVISMVYEDTDDVFLDCLIIPVLRHLVAERLPLSSLTSFLARSGCQLETLTLGLTEDFFGTPEDFRTLLEHTPSLVHLSLDADMGSDFCWDDLFTVLTLRPSSSDGAHSPCLIPKLDNFDLVAESSELDVYPSDGVVEEMLRSRMSPFLVDNDSSTQLLPAAASLRRSHIQFSDYDCVRVRSWFITNGGDIICEDQG